MIKILREIILIGLLVAAGMIIGNLTGFPFSLSSMILFMILLLSGILKEDYFSDGISDLVLKNLSFFFLPPAVKILDSLSVLQGVWPRILLVMLISNFMIMGVTGMVVQHMLKKEEVND